MMDNEEIIQELIDALEETVECLIWCGGSSDFAYPDGKASEGWQNTAIPAIDKASKLLLQVK